MSGYIIVRVTPRKFGQCQVDTSMLQHGRNGAQGSASIQLHELAIVPRLDGVSYEHHAAHSVASTSSSSSVAGVRNALIAEGKRQNFRDHPISQSVFPCRSTSSFGLLIDGIERQANIVRLTSPPASPASRPRSTTSLRSAGPASSLRRGP
jgi:hypothetical protein